MNRHLNKKSTWLLRSILIAVILVLTSCKQSPSEWKKEEVVTEFGDRFEHFYRIWPGGFPDPDYEHRILFKGKELLTYHEDDPESIINCIYKDKIIVYNISSDYFYRRDKEDVFQTFPFDTQKKEFYPAYYRLLLARDIDTTRMLLSVGDNYAKKVVLAFAKGDFSEAEEQGIFLSEAEIETEKSFYSELVEEYHLAK